MSSIKYVKDQVYSLMSTYRAAKPIAQSLKNKKFQSLNIQEIPAQLSTEILGFSLSYSSILEISTLIAPIRNLHISRSIDSKVALH